MRRNGPRYEVQTKYGWFSLDEGAYQDYLAGKLWITWPPDKNTKKTNTEFVPQNVSQEAISLRDEASKKGVTTVIIDYCKSPIYYIPDIQRLAQTGIEELSLSVRSSNGLMRAGINTFGKLAESLNQEGGLFKIRNLGVKSEKEIRQVFVEECYHRMLPYEKAEYWQAFIEKNSIRFREGV